MKPIYLPKKEVKQILKKKKKKKEKEVKQNNYDAA